LSKGANVGHSLNTNPGKAVDLAIEHAGTLPSHYYVAPQLLEREKWSIFWRTWQIVGRSEQVRNSGDYFTADLLGEPLLIARGADGTLRGFYNVCRHRAGPPAEGSGSRKVFRCGYHGWTYGLDGRLLNAPEMDGVKNFCAEDLRLRPIHVGEWEGQVFANLDPNAEPPNVEPLMDALRELPLQAAKYNFGKMRLCGRREYHMQCNWKVYIDNYLEGYHLPSVHPSLNRELDYNSYVTTLFENHSLQFSPIRGPENESSVDRRYRQSNGDLSAEYFWIFPNWMLNCYPDNVSLNIVLPTGPETCMAIFEWYFPPDQGTAIEETIRFSDEIQLEDGHICEVVHRNLKSQSYDTGRYSVKQEQGVHHFHLLYLDAIHSGR
jgi:choline monooxygenase